MIERYQREQLKKLWRRKTKFETWLEVELLACEAWQALGIIEQEDIEKLRANATIDIPRIKEIEKETKHDVIAFTRAISETLRRREEMDPLRSHQYRRSRHRLWCHL